MKKTTKLQKTEAYENASMDIASLLDRITTEVDFLNAEYHKSPSDFNWGQIGDLQCLRNNLVIALGQISGMDSDTITDVLEDLRDDARRNKQ
jgi:hypothetical protein